MSFYRKYKELLLGVGILLIGVFYGVSTASVQLRVNTTISARYVPYGLAAICIIVGACQCYSSVRIAAAYQHEPDKESDNLAVVLLLAAILLYALVLKKLGFLFSTPVLLFFMMLLMAPKSKRSPLLFAAISVVSTVIVYYAFRSGLNLMLPGGILG